nr:hypothetical protein [Pyrinomonadaceae bacterium]
MKNFVRFCFCLTILISLFCNNLLIGYACGPSYLEPVFEFRNVAERPWTDFANGKLGIIKPTFNRSVLFAAHRYLNGGGFSPDEQKALIQVWEAEFNNKSYEDNDVTETVKEWLKERKSVVQKEEKLPAIYVEREYIGGYD